MLILLIYAWQQKPGSIPFWQHCCQRSQLSLLTMLISLIPCTYRDYDDFNHSYYLRLPCFHLLYWNILKILWNKRISVARTVYRKVKGQHSFQFWDMISWIHIYSGNRNHCMSTILQASGSHDEPDNSCLLEKYNMSVLNTNYLIFY